MRILILLSFIYRFLTNVASAQAQIGYSLIGSAQSAGSKDCYQLTAARQGQTGAVWFDKQLDLTKSFELEFSLNFGTDTHGADGMAVVFQNQGKQVLGGSGGGIGYGNLRPSLAIEFDTSYNPDFGDPTFDHIALTANGVNNHLLNTNFPPPTAISVTQHNVKDAQDHYVKVNWQASLHKLRVEVDCKIRIDQTVDFVNSLFSGVPDVYWGFTSATGSANNAQSVCVHRIKSSPDTVQACRNELVALNAPLSNHDQYSWSPAVGLDKPYSPNPILKVTNDQVYTVQYIDYCNQSQIDSVLVQAKGISLFIGDDRQICENEVITLPAAPLSTTNSVAYKWSTGESIPQIHPTTSGLYSLTVTADGCTTTDTISILFNPLPVLSPTKVSYDCPAGDPILLSVNAVGPNLSYLWQPGNSSSQTLEAKTPGKYSVTVTTSVGCSATQQFTIMDNCPALHIHIPNAFTPNGDGVNDFLRWYGERLSNVQLSVLNRWGEIVFSSTTVNPYWDGTYQGSLCKPDVYTWQLRYVLAPSGTLSISQGNVLLMR